MHHENFMQNAVDICAVQKNILLDVMSCYNHVMHLIGLLV